MSLIFIAPNRDMRPWKEAVLQVDADLDVEIWPNIEDQKRVQFAVTWHQPAHVLEQYSNLQGISSLGAGADHILADETVPPHIPVCRIVSPNLMQQMKEYIFNAVLNFQRNTFLYFKQRQQGIWKEHANKNTAALPIGVMGLGALGAPVSRQLSAFGYSVYGWSRSEKELAGVSTFAGNDELGTFISNTRILICLLPLTPATKNIIDIDVLKHLQRPGYLINGARGEHVVDEDLIYALDMQWIQGACLDVFREEPLPSNHPFWNRSNIMITPHVSSITHPDEVARQIVENYKAVLSGLPLMNEINRRAGY